MIGTDEVQPVDSKFPKINRTVTVRFGEPIAVLRYGDRADDRMALRELTDEVTYEIGQLSGYEYVEHVRDEEGRKPPHGGRSVRDPRRRAGRHRRRVVAVSDVGTGASGILRHPKPLRRGSYATEVTYPWGNRPPQCLSRSPETATRRRRTWRPVAHCT